MRAFSSSVDLNVELPFRQDAGLCPGGHLENRQDSVRPVDGLPAVGHIHAIRESLRWRSIRQDADRRRAITRDGVRPVYLSREPARHRDLSDRVGCQSILHSIPRGGSSFHLGRCQQKARLAHLRRFRPTSDCAGQKVVSLGRPWPVVVEHGLCPARRTRTLDLAYLVQCFSQVAHDVELVEPDRCMRRVRDADLAKRLPHVHHRLTNALDLPLAQPFLEQRNAFLRAVLPTETDRTTANQIAHGTFAECNQ